eukprot:5588348-Pyramimonas_sp.AAC.1
MPRAAGLHRRARARVPLRQDHGVLQAPRHHAADPQHREPLQGAVRGAHPGRRAPPPRAWGLPPRARPRRQDAGPRAGVAGARAHAAAAVRGGGHPVYRSVVQRFARGWLGRRRLHALKDEQRANMEAMERIRDRLALSLQQ